MQSSDSPGEKSAAKPIEWLRRSQENGNYIVKSVYACNYLKQIPPKHLTKNLETVKYF